MKLLLDFDDTLFDAQAFAYRLKHIFFTQGVSENDFNKSYKPITYSPSGYTIKRHIEILCKDFRYSLKVKLLYREVQNLFEHSDQFLFEDTIKTLEQWHKTHTLALVTMGNPSWQKRKINGCGIARFFTRMIIPSPGDRAKNSAIETYCTSSNERCIFVDDKPSIIDGAASLKPRFPHLVIIRMRRGVYANEPGGEADFNVLNLQEADGILRRISKDNLDE